MALVKCPECGKEVSDRASACIHCGCPLGKKDTIVKVRAFAEDVSTDFKLCFFKMGFIELARVPSGAVATFEVDEPTEITVQSCFGLFQTPKGELGKFVAEPGKCYEASFRKVSFWEKTLIVSEVSFV